MAEVVDNSHLDAGIAARETAKEAKTETVTETPAAAETVAEEVVAEAVETQNDPESSADSDEPDAQPQKPKNRGVGKRIDELTKEKYDAQRERDYWREQAMRQQPQQPETAQTAEQESDEPTLESCDFDVGKFNRQWYEWRKNEDRKVEQQQARERKSQESFAAFRAEHPDFDSVVTNPALTITQAMASEVQETENPAAVAYYLGKNPAEAADIAQMSERAMSRAIGRIEARLSAPPPAPVTPRQPEPKSRPFEPVTTLSGAPAVSKSYEDMSQSEYEAARRKEREAKGLR